MKEASNERESKRLRAENQRESESGGERERDQDGDSPRRHDSAADAED
jgi:hypothetical protein